MPGWLIVGVHYGSFSSQATGSNAAQEQKYVFLLHTSLHFVGYRELRAVDVQTTTLKLESPKLGNPTGTEKPLASYSKP